MQPLALRHFVKRWRILVARAAPRTVTSCGSRMNCAPAWRCCRVGGREQQCLAPLRAVLRDGGDVVGEAHVEHAVGFVEHQRVERCRGQRPRPGGPGCGPACRPRRARRVRSLASCGRIATPPHRVSTLMLPSARARRRISCVTWSASSRVGHSTSACTAKRRGFRFASSAMRRRRSCRCRSWPGRSGPCRASARQAGGLDRRHLRRSRAA